MRADRFTCFSLGNVMEKRDTTKSHREVITCSTVMLQCYRRQAIPMEQAKIRRSVSLYSLDRSLPNLAWLIMSATPTHIPILVKFGSVANSPQIGEI